MSDNNVYLFTVEAINHAHNGLSSHVPEERDAAETILSITSYHLRRRAFALPEEAQAHWAVLRAMEENADG